MLSLSRAKRFSIGNMGKSSSANLSSSSSFVLRRISLSFCPELMSVRKKFLYSSASVPAGILVSGTLSQQVISYFRTREYDLLRLTKADLGFYKCYKNDENIVGFLVRINITCDFRICCPLFATYIDDHKALVRLTKSDHEIAQGSYGQPGQRVGGGTKCFIEMVPVQEDVCPQLTTLLDREKFPNTRR
jgi:hypothetical protein